MKISKILEKTEKKLDISGFFNTKDDYITIKKLTPAIKRKMQIISVSKMNGKDSQKVMMEFAKHGEEITNDQAIKIMSKTGAEVQTNMIEMSGILEELVIDNGLDPTKHTFVDDKDKPIQLNYQTLLQFATPEFLSYLTKEIQSFSNGFTLGE